MKEYATNDIFIMAAIEYEFGITPDQYVYVPGNTEFQDRMTAMYKDAKDINLDKIQQFMEYKRLFLTRKAFIFNEIKDRRKQDE